MYEAAYNRDLLTQAYAGDLADLVTELQQRAERAEAALAERDKPCAFEQEDHEDFSCIWITDCGGRYWLEDGTPDQHYEFCPSCGHPFVVRLPSHNDLLSAGGEAGNE